MKKKFFIGIAAAICCTASCNSVHNKEYYKYPFLNPKLTSEERAADLVSRLTLEQKIKQMRHPAAAVDSLFIKRYNWWNECLHGVART